MGCQLFYFVIHHFYVGDYYFTPLVSVKLFIVFHFYRLTHWARRDSTGGMSRRYSTLRLNNSRFPFTARRYHASLLLELNVVLRCFHFLRLIRIDHVFTTYSWVIFINMEGLGLSVMHTLVSKVFPISHLIQGVYRAVVHCLTAISLSQIIKLRVTQMLFLEFRSSLCTHNFKHV
jgi:hypothetical protein